MIDVKNIRGLISRVVKGRLNLDNASNGKETVEAFVPGSDIVNKSVQCIGVAYVDGVVVEGAAEFEVCDFGRRGSQGAV